MAVTSIRSYVDDSIAAGGVYPAGWWLPAPQAGWIGQAGRPDERNPAVSGTDKVSNKAEELAGQAKEKYGEAAGDEDKKNEGKADQVKSNLKDAGEKVKDAFRD